jgi:hypothetical protein
MEILKILLTLLAPLLLYLPGKYASFLECGLPPLFFLLHADQFSNLEISERDSQGPQRKRLPNMRFLPSEFSKGI